MSKRINRNSFGSFLTCLIIGGALVASLGCDLESVAFGLGDYGWEDGWDGGYGYDDNYASDYVGYGDYYSNWYTDTTVGGDGEDFYIAGDGFTYTSW